MTLESRRESSRMQMEEQSIAKESLYSSLFLLYSESQTRVTWNLFTVIRIQPSLSFWSLCRLFPFSLTPPLSQTGCSCNYKKFGECTSRSRHNPLSGREESGREESGRKVSQVKRGVVCILGSSFLFLVAWLAFTFFSQTASLLCLASGFPLLIQEKDKQASVVTNDMTVKKEASSVTDIKSFQKTNIIVNKKDKHFLWETTVST